MFNHQEEKNYNVSGKVGRGAGPSLQRVIGMVNAIQHAHGPE